MLLQAALNGAHPPGAHPALPITLEALALAGADAVAAGAGAIHLHVRDIGGRETLAAEDVALTVATMRGAVAVPVGVSTGTWIVPDPAERETLVRGWTVLPDYASVNFHEDGAAALAELLLGRGVGIEAGLRDERAAESWVASGLAPRCLRALYEPAESVAAKAIATADAIDAVLDRAGIAGARMLHGLAATAWPLIDEAARRGYDTRIGLEDTLHLPDGHVAPDNAALVTAARAIIAKTRGGRS